MFHMADWEAGRGEFSGWESDRKRVLLNALLSLMAKHVKVYLAFDIGVVPSKKIFRNTYQKALTGILFQAFNWTGQESLSIVLDSNMEYGLPTFSEYWRGTEYAKRINSFSVAKAKLTCPL